MEIDKKIAEWLGIVHFIRDYHWCFDVERTGTIAGNVLLDGFHDWLLSPPGTVAMMEALLRDGIEPLPMTMTSNRSYVIVLLKQRPYAKIDWSRDLPTAVYEAARKYLGDK